MNRVLTSISQRSGIQGQTVILPWSATGGSCGRMRPEFLEEPIDVHWVSMEQTQQMSEYQIVRFRAIDRPLTDKQMEFMDQQSSRAECTKWDFEIEYQYSSFRGDVDGMLRHGFDLFLLYSNYGCREIRMRLPNGLPFPKNVLSNYLNVNGLEWNADKTGKGGILRVAPYLDEAYDEVSEFDDYLDATAKLREMLIAGDLRALYVLWLCCAMHSILDNEGMLEPPVPHGLGTLPDDAADLLTFFETDPLLVEAAAIDIPAFNTQLSKDDSEQDDSAKVWLTSVNESRRVKIIQRLLSEDPFDLKAELLAEIRDSQKAFAWPVEPPSRTLANLREVCETLQRKEEEKQQRQAAAKARRDADKAEKQRLERMKEMKSDPEAWLKKASKLVEERGTDNYREAASILADLRDAVGGEQGDRIARKHAAHLAQKHPTLGVFKSSLRKKQLLD